MTELQMLSVAYVLFVLLIAGEALLSLVRRDGRYRLGEAVVNIGHGVVYQVWDGFTKGLVLVPFFAVASLVTWPVLPLDSIWGWVVGLLIFDFLAYWAHRHHHEVHILWAIHGVHHAAEDFNFAAALRQAQFQHLFKWAWKLPLALCMPFEMFTILVVFDYVYQFVQHTRYIPKLGPIEWVFNTPSHHRVHHGRDDKYLDKNYGGILIIWDRLFGTFQVEEEEPDFGLTKPLNTLNAVWGNLAIWVELAAASRRARGLDALRLWLLGPAHLERLAPGGPRPEPRVLENRDVPLGRAIYVMASGLVLTLLLGWLSMSGADWALPARIGLAGFIVVSTMTTGALLERTAWARPVEIARLLAGAVGFSIAAGSAWPALVFVLALGALFLTELPPGAWSRFAPLRASLTGAARGLAHPSPESQPATE